jgi:hypothetical protein
LPCRPQKRGSFVRAAVEQCFCDRLMVDRHGQLACHYRPVALLPNWVAASACAFALHSLAHVDNMAFSRFRPNWRFSSDVLARPTDTHWRVCRCRQPESRRPRQEQRGQTERRLLPCTPDYALRSTFPRRGVGRRRLLFVDNINQSDRRPAPVKRICCWA